MISIIQPDGLIYSILQCLGIDISSLDPNSMLYMTCIIIASVFVLAVIFMILKCCTSFFRGGRL